MRSSALALRSRRRLVRSIDWGEGEAVSFGIAG
jgi:hypothetical protein